MAEYTDQNGQPIDVSADGLRLAAIQMTLTNKVDSEIYTSTLKPLKFVGIEREASFLTDPDSYAKLVGGNLFTVEITQDFNPYHRHATTRRQRLRKAWDCAWWTFRRRVLRRRLIATSKVTVPDCQLIGAVEDDR